MVCNQTKPVYMPNKNGGCSLASPQNDGYSIAIDWDKAYPSTSGYTIAYNIYYSTIREDVFSEGVKYVALDDGFLNVKILDLVPGDTYYFAVRGTEFAESWVNLALLQDGFPDLKVYTEGVLLEDIDDSQLTIPVSDINLWPAYGIIQVGTELIRYDSKDIPSETLIASERGFLETNIRFHNTDGYDGEETQDPIVKFWKGFEDGNTIVQQATNGFYWPNFIFTEADGYATQTDIVTTNLTASDVSSQDFLRFDFSGWHRTDPRDLLRGECIGSYYGGSINCADGYLGVNNQIRGIPIQDHIARREEVLLETWGEPVVLVKRLWSGIRCPCIIATVEQPEYRCTKCLSTGFLTGYEQFFNPRRSDGRIMIRIDATVEDKKIENSGIDNLFIPNCWTIVFPAIQDFDFFIRFDENGNEEFRYEILNVTRNVLFESTLGAQKFTAKRIQKTDPIYQFKAFRNTATMPQKLTTSIGFLAGPSGTQIAHTHDIVINENITSLSQINQTTSVSQGHNHTVRQGMIIEELGHNHIITLP